MEAECFISQKKQKLSGVGNSDFDVRTVILLMTYSLVYFFCVFQVAWHD